MKPIVEVNELMERIREAASRENGQGGKFSQEISAETDLPPVPEALPLPPLPESPAAGGSQTKRPEALLDEIASFLLGGQKKNAVPANVPTVMRPLFRNQGGVNGVVLEAVARLLELNRNLCQQNYDLHERMMNFHVWTHAVAEASAENQNWMLVADAHLRASTESRFAHIEERLAQLEKRRAPLETSEPLPAAPPQTEARLTELAARLAKMEEENRHLREQIKRAQAQGNEQSAYLRTVHGHLDRLGAHVESGFARLTAG